MEEAIVLDRVRKSFGGLVAVDDLSLRVPTGCIYGFLGPNGAGKTTTMRMILAILYPDSGRISVLGHSTAERVRNRVGYLPEERGLYAKMRVEDFIAYIGRLKGMDGHRAKTRAGALLEEFGLGDARRKRCEALSRGMRQKVQILSALVHDPELAILDEPFSGLDPVNLELMRDAITRMKRDGKTVILSTHMMEQAEQICDSILLIDRGKKVVDGPLAQVRASGGQGILLDYDGDGAILRDLPDIRRVNDAGQQAELLLEEGADPQEILARLVGKVRIRRFDLREPSLHEVFIRAVGGKSDA